MAAEPGHRAPRRGRARRPGRRARRRVRGRRQRARRRRGDRVGGSPPARHRDRRRPDAGRRRAVGDARHPRAGAETAIVALSADESERIVLEMLNAGAVAYLRKGVSAPELASPLREALRARERLDGPGA